MQVQTVEEAFHLALGALGQRRDAVLVSKWDGRVDIRHIGTSDAPVRPRRDDGPLGARGPNGATSQWVVCDVMSVSGLASVSG